jgi:hypothetical protein
MVNFAIELQQNGLEKEKDEINAMFPNGVDSRPLNCDADEKKLLQTTLPTILTKPRQFHDHCNILKTKLNKVSAMTTPSSQSRLTSFKEKSLAIQKKKESNTFRTFAPSRSHLIKKTSIPNQKV